MNGTIKTLKLHHKMLFPNVLSIILVSAIIFFFVNSNVMLNTLAKKQQKADNTRNLIQQTALNIQSYMDNHMSYNDLSKLYRSMLGEVKQQDISTDFKDLWTKVGEIHKIRQEDRGIGHKVNDLMDYSIKQSNTYINKMAQELADPTARANVSTLERQIIAGANANTSSNYRLKVLFAQMKGDISKKRDLLAFISEQIGNAKDSMKRLAGTPFASLPQNSINSLLQVKELTIGYVKNVNSENLLQHAIASGIQERLKAIEKVKTEDNAELFSKLKSYFRSMLIIILLTSLIGVLTSLLAARSVVKALRNIIYGLSGASHEVSSAAGQLSSASQSLAGSASEQAASIEEISASLEEISGLTRQNTKNTTDAENMMREANQIYDNANASLEQLTASMNEISKTSAEASKIIKTIDEIAFQTNLLALNAAVEAASAGEAGAGFAVVADEVRNLALRAADAAKNTTSLIEGIVKKVQYGSGLVTGTNHAFDQLGKSTTRIAALIAEIATASKEQSIGIGQISTAMSQTDQLIQKNSANAEQTAAASQEMTAQAEQMKKLLAGLVALVGEGRRHSGVDHDQTQPSEKDDSLLQGDPTPLGEGDPAVAESEPFVSN